jgi:hypothetical protein
MQKKHYATALYWAPRIMGILFIIFISMFALDVFSEGYSFWQTIIALGMHLIPSIILLLFLFLAWRWESIGGFIFIGLGILYIVIAWGQFHWSAYFTISGPAILLGILFLLHWYYKKKTSA